jgi:hypothetical protein
LQAGHPGQVQIDQRRGKANASGGLLIGPFERLRTCAGMAQLRFDLQLAQRCCHALAHVRVVVDE